MRAPVTRPFPLAVFFTLDGMIFATWAVRIPAIKHSLGLSTTSLGIALLCLSLGALLSISVSGSLVVRFGTRPMLLTACTLVSAGLVLPAVAGSVIWLAVVLALFGLVYGALNISLNSAAVEVEASTGRPLMSMLHGLWSVGCLAGSLLGGLLAGHLGTAAHFGLVTAMSLIVTAICAPAMLRDPGLADTTALTATAGSADQRAKTPVAQTAQRLGLPVVIFGVVALCVAYGEGAVADWSGVHLREGLGAGASMAAYAFAAYNLAIAGGRLAGGRLIGRLGVTGVLSGGAVVAAGGILVAAWTEQVPVAFAGFIAVGLGLANVFPLAIARAGALGGPNGVSLATGIGHTGMLAGPPLIGFLADHAGLPTALSTIAVMSMAVAVLAVLVKARSASTPVAAPALPAPAD
jgi:MFS family permease